MKKQLSAVYFWRNPGEYHAHVEWARWGIDHKKPYSDHKNYDNVTIPSLARLCAVCQDQAHKLHGTTYLHHDGWSYYPEFTADIEDLIRQVANWWGQSYIVLNKETLRDVLNRAIVSSPTE
jgi:hypothetical protein